VANQGGVYCNRRSCYQTGPASVAVYPAGSDGNAKPSAVIYGPDTNLASPSAIAVDHRGDIYVTNEGRAECERYFGCYPAGPGSITVYAPGSSGNAKLIATISGADTGLGSPYAITVDWDGNIYVLNLSGENVVAGRVTILPITSNRTVTTNSFGSAAAPDSYVNPPLYTKILGAGGIDVVLIFAAGSNGDVAPIGAIGGPFTGLYGPQGIAIGP
jgi:hypothetical protein